MRKLCLFPTGRQLLTWLLPALLATGAARAQSPSWTLLAASSSAGGSTGGSATRAVAADAAGNVVVAGYFSGSATFGTTTLTSRGGDDLFVAKYVPATNTWAWALSGGGTGDDRAFGLAVSGSSIYLTGTCYNNRANASAVQLGSATGAVSQPGATPTASQDILLVKYQDNGSSAALTWTQVAGGTEYDQGSQVAVSGSSVYVVGTLVNDLGNSFGVLFGGSGSTAGTYPQLGAAPAGGQDIVLAKYTDNGSGATLGWTQLAGGAGSDYGQGLAVSGSSVYITGVALNNRNNVFDFRLGGSGTAPGTYPQLGATATLGADLLLAKYTDNGPTGSFRWSQIAGGTSNDGGEAVAVSGSSVYVTGSITNNYPNDKQVVLGGSGSTVGTATQLGSGLAVGLDWLLAKYTDQGSSATFGWSQVAGGGQSDIAYQLAAQGSRVLLTGYISPGSGFFQVVFGGSGTTPGTLPVNGATNTSGEPDLAVASYTDQGSRATVDWVQVAGGFNSDMGLGLALSGQQVYVGGFATPDASFGSFTLTGPFGSRHNVLARLSDPTLLSVRAAAGAAGPAVYPSPASTSATLTGAAPGALVEVLDALGRPVLATPTDAAGTAPLPLATLPRGLYLVRVGSHTVRLAVE